MSHIAQRIEFIREFIAPLRVLPRRRTYYSHKNCCETQAITYSGDFIYPGLKIDETTGDRFFLFEDASFIKISLDRFPERIYKDFDFYTVLETKINHIVDTGIMCEDIKSNNNLIQR